MPFFTQKPTVTKKNADLFKNKFNNGKKEPAELKEQNIKKCIVKQNNNFNKKEKNLMK